MSHRWKIVYPSLRGGAVPGYQTKVFLNDVLLEGVTAVVLEAGVHDVIRMDVRLLVQDLEIEQEKSPD